MNLDTPASVTDTMHALAYIGDLTMGQPTDHSLRTAWLAWRIAEAAGCGDADCAAVPQVALLRWSGCTANAPEFSELLGDDVEGRALMLSQKLDDPAYALMGQRLHGDMQRLAEIHCEVSGDVARMLNVSDDVELALRSIFSTADGASPSVFIVALASDVEVLSRVQGLERALSIIVHKSGHAYPAALAAVAVRHASQWLEVLDRDESWHADLAFGAATGDMVPLELLADVIDLKLPWMTGYSRRVAEAARCGALAMGLEAETAQRCYRAGLLHGIGRAAVPNTVWNTVGRLSAAAREQLRLAPYWTSRSTARLGTLSDAAHIGSYAAERLDGSGAFRACAGAAIPFEGLIVAAATAWVALQSARPWRAAMTLEQARAVLESEAAGGRFDAGAARAVTGGTTPAAVHTNIVLTEREIEVFRGISLGQTNKEVARALAISPSTVRTHVENVFRKLGCTTRAAATLKASTLRLL
ncbi:HD domain-containing phosphohydrolase [Duganella sp. LjRoot269]|jgi:HD-GYP domain-containing protein (c-di-GMP phosphodiesterase class II)/DNA-binding CsgD family transcriptional regulator|uniref:HD domain-containing phosphohydrolase n=1 Tax=Duganella sp. LjRoot269 TaxID=3342305 RepID=UPI003ECE2EAF